MSQHGYKRTCVETLANIIVDYTHSSSLPPSSTPTALLISSGRGQSGW